MNRANIQFGLEKGHFAYPLKMFNGHWDGLALGFGTVFPAAAVVGEGWAPGARFFVVAAHDEANTGAQYLNTGTAGTAIWTRISTPVPRTAIMGIPASMDTQVGADGTDHVLIPAWMNKRGLVIEHCFAIVTEVFAGLTDVGIVTVSDASDNAICTLTPNGATADVVNDYILGFQAASTATGAAGFVVDAGEYVDCVVTQEATDSGIMSVFIIATPLA